MRGALIELKLEPSRKGEGWTATVRELLIAGGNGIGGIPD